MRMHRSSGIWSSSDLQWQAWVLARRVCLCALFEKGWGWNQNQSPLLCYNFMNFTMFKFSWAVLTCKNYCHLLDLCWVIKKKYESFYSNFLNTISTSSANFNSKKKIGKYDGLTKKKKITFGGSFCIQFQLEGK